MSESPAKSPVHSFYLFVGRVFVASLLGGTLDLIFYWSQGGSGKDSSIKIFFFTMGFIIVLALPIEFFIFAVRGVFSRLVASGENTARIMARAAAFFALALPAVMLPMLFADFIRESRAFPFYLAGYILLWLLIFAGAYSSLSEYWGKLIESAGAEAKGFKIPLTISLAFFFLLSIYLIGLFIGKTPFFVEALKDARLLMAYGLLLFSAFLLNLLKNKALKIVERSRAIAFSFFSLAIVMAPVFAGFSAAELLAWPTSKGKTVAEKTLIARGTYSLLESVVAPDKAGSMFQQPDIAKPDRRPSFIVITVESLPEPGLLCGELISEKLPILKRMSEESLFFTKAYAQSPVTPFNLASLMTGKAPHKIMFDKFGGSLPLLMEANETIAERLKKRSYKTIMLGGGNYLFPKYGFDQGFDEWHPVEKPEDSLAIIAQKASDQMDYLTEEGADFLMWLNFPSSDETEDNCPPAQYLERLNEGISSVIENFEANRLKENTVLFFASLSGSKNCGETGAGCLLEPNLKSVFFFKTPEKLKGEYEKIIPNSSIFYLLDSFSKSLEEIITKEALSKILKENNLLSSFVSEIPPEVGSAPEVALFSEGWKLVYIIDESKYRLYNLRLDERGENDLSQSRPLRLSRIKAELAEILGGRETLTTGE